MHTERKYEVIYVLNVELSYHAHGSNGKGALSSLEELPTVMKGLFSDLF
jgi:hypothetical protein